MDDKTEQRATTDSAKQGNKLPLEMAEQEFDRFVECMDLYFDPESMDSEDKTAFEKQRGRILRAIQKGSLIINGSGEAVFTPYNKKSKHDSPITFHERTGGALMAMDGKKKNEDMRKTYAVMAEMCSTHPSTFANLVGEDGKICEALFTLLMD